MGYIKIYLVNNRYDVVTPDGKLHILSRKAFDWNMKKVFGLTAKDLKGVHMVLDQVGHTQVDLDFVNAGRKAI
jgi:hypothetical protein